MTKREYERLQRFITDIETNFCNARLIITHKGTRYTLIKAPHTHGRFMREHTEWKKGHLHFWYEDMLNTLILFKQQWNHLRVIESCVIIPKDNHNFQGRKHQYDSEYALIYF